jgi:hypothetical protein
MAKNKGRKKTVVPAKPEGTPGTPEAAKRQRTRLHEQSAENDIKYRGPISYQGFQVLGWLCFVCGAIGTVLTIAIKADSSVTDQFMKTSVTLKSISDLSLPFLLIATFSRILANNDGYKKQLISSGGAAAGIAIASAFLFMRYGVGAIGRVVTEPDEVLPTLTQMFRKSNKEGFIAFNLFIDMFLCTLTMYFLNARPKKVFTGKKVRIFRLFTLLPVAYEAFALILKVRSSIGVVTIPFWMFPLLPMKPPMSFALFLFLSLHMKGREQRYRRNGKSHQDYLDFLKTNRNSLHFSIYLAVAIIVAAVLDYVLMMVLVSAQTGMTREALQAATREADVVVMQYLVGIEKIGIGKTTIMAALAPIMFLFSYNRVPKYKIISLLAPVMGIVLSVLVFLEGALAVLSVLTEGRKIDLTRLRELIKEIGTLIKI